MTKTIGDCSRLCCRAGKAALAGKTIYDKDEIIDLSADEKPIVKRAMQSELLSRQKSR